MNWYYCTTTCTCSRYSSTFYSHILAAMKCIVFVFCVACAVLLLSDNTCANNLHKYMYM